MSVGAGKQEFRSFAEFWPFYVQQHSRPITRTLHFIGSTGALACAAAGAAAHPGCFLLAPLVGYGFAWIGHFGFEKNKPATFRYPLYSFLADWVLWSKMLTGRMGPEAERILKPAAGI